MIDKNFEFRVIHYESGNVMTVKYTLPVDTDGRINMSRATSMLSTDYQILAIKPLKD